MIKQNTMAEQIPLQAIPNQTLNVVLDEVSWEIDLVYTGSMMLITLARGVNAVVTSMRCIPGAAMIPWQLLAAGGGNFFWETPNGEIVDYVNFGGTHNLIYLSAAEIAGLAA